MYTVYILKSMVKDWYYIGHTNDIESRFKQHNTGLSKATRPYKPFVIIHKEVYITKSKAFKREQQIKRFRHGEAFNKLIGV